MKTKIPFIFILFLVISISLVQLKNRESYLVLNKIDLRDYSFPSSSVIELNEEILSVTSKNEMDSIFGFFLSLNNNYKEVIFDEKNKLLVAETPFFSYRINYSINSLRQLTLEHVKIITTEKSYCEN